MSKSIFIEHFKLLFAKYIVGYQEIFYFKSIRNSIRDSFSVRFSFFRSLYLAASTPRIVRFVNLAISLVFRLRRRSAQNFRSLAVREGYLSRSVLKKCSCIKSKFF